MSLFEDIWAAHRTGRTDGPYEELSVDMVYGHEGTLALVLPELVRLGGPKVAAERLFFVADHFAPPSSGAFADVLRGYLGFCGSRGIGVKVFEGIGHRLMLEDAAVGRGMFVVGADSHTTTIVAKGALGIGLGSRDVLAALMTGTVWLKRPAEAAVVLHGRLPELVEMKDAVLALLRRAGQAGFLGQVISFRRAEAPRLTVEQLAVPCNMSVELGAVSAVFDAEAGEAEPAGGLARLCLTTLVPLVARPGAPDAVVPVAELAGTRVDSAHIGSCASGGIEDLRAAARVLHGRHVAAGCVLYVTPATRSIYVQAMQEGVLAELSAAGAVILNPSCGACGGIDKGIPAAGEVMVTTAPRNYSSRARVGSEAYLASTATVAASAVKGALTDPRGLA